MVIVLLLLRNKLSEDHDHICSNFFCEGILITVIVFFSHIQSPLTSDI